MTFRRLLSVLSLVAAFAVPAVLAASPAHAIDPFGDACSRMYSLGQICSPQ